MATVNGTTYTTKPGFTPTAGTSGYDGRMVRLATIGNALPGLYASGHLAVTQRAAGANMSVDIAAGQCYVDPQSVAFQGVYLADFAVATNSSTDHGIVWTASDATNPRIDLLCVEVRDQDYGGTFTGERFVLLTGTPSASATHQLEAQLWPTITTGLVPIAAILRAPGVSGAGINTIISSQITNLNPIGGSGRCSTLYTSTAETTASTSFTRLATPDAVMVYVPSNSALVRFRYKSQWKVNVASGLQDLALFIDGNQLKQPLGDSAPVVTSLALGSTGPVASTFYSHVQSSGHGTTAAGNSTSAAIPCFSTVRSTVADVSEVTTGQTVHLSSGTWTTMGASQIPGMPGTIDVGGLLAGWHEFEIRYKTSANTLSVRERRMWAEVVG